MDYLFRIYTSFTHYYFDTQVFNVCKSVNAFFTNYSIKNYKMKKILFLLRFTVYTFTLLIFLFLKK